MHRKLFLCGLVIWLAATALLRLAGQRVLHPDNVSRTLILFAVSFPLMALLVRRLCRKFHVPPEAWPAAAISLALPTLLLDPFSSAFFPTVFPNIPASAAGIFGGWMLWCCAGALAGAIFWRQSKA
jgi:Family of unknown function (DUF5367)